MLNTSSSPEQQAERLRTQIGWITRVSSALSAANTWEDVVIIKKEYPQVLKKWEEEMTPGSQGRR